MTNEEENVLNNTLNKMEYFTKLLGNRNTYEKEEQCARIVKDLSEAYLNITKAGGMRLEEAEYFYGGENIVITPEEFEALKQGKILNIGINEDSQVMGISYLHKVRVIVDNLDEGDEYGITIRLSDDILNKE